MIKYLLRLFRKPLSARTASALSMFDKASLKLQKVNEEAQRMQAKNEEVLAAIQKENADLLALSTRNTNVIAKLNALVEA